MNPSATMERLAAPSCPAAKAMRSCFLGKPVGHRSATVTTAAVTGCRRSARTTLLIIRCDASGKKTIAITGATGLVGSRLVSRLSSRGDKVHVLTRNTQRAKSLLPFPNIAYYEPAAWTEGVKGSDGVVNLAGEPIGTRWTPQIKQEILDSRVSVTKKLAAIINALPEGDKPKVLVSSSAVGYYGVSDTSTFNETSPAGADYLAEVCKQWEAAAAEAQAPRTVIIRTGIVLAKNGGAIARMLPVFQLFAGGPLGTGQQWCSWIHRDDLVNLILDALADEKYSGTYNGTAPQPVRMSELCSSLGSTLGRPSWLPVPDFAVQTLLGEGASVVLDGQKVIPSRAQEAGFRFKYNKIEEAMANILR